MAALFAFQIDPFRSGVQRFYSGFRFMASHIPLLIGHIHAGEAGDVHVPKHRGAGWEQRRSQEIRIKVIAS